MILFLQVLMLVLFQKKRLNVGPDEVKRVHTLGKEEVPYLDEANLSDPW